MSIKILSRSDLSKNIAVIVGTRPGIIKFSPVIRALIDRNMPFFIVHTGQHYSYNMDRQFFKDLELPKPRYTNEHVRKELLHGAQTAEMLKGVERALLESKPSVVIVGGDANTNLAGALAARKLGLTLAHMEAGLRSQDWRMPEEHNRVIIDHISDVLLAPTEQSKKNLLEDNVKGEIHVVGNPIVDAVLENIRIANEKSEIRLDLGIKNTKYVLLTFHREENVDHYETLLKLIAVVDKVIESCGSEVIFPIHPRTRKRLEHYNLWSRINNISKLVIINPVGYLDFLSLMQYALIIMTDSGGVQEEACILKVPCVTLRDNTERPETVDVGANIVSGYEPDSVLHNVQTMIKKRRDWPNPFGDGKSAKRIADILQHKL